ncbi:MAG TPA: hypothetical protein ENN20_09810 [Candidatus Marinimicrobia bacterium]|nr:hypothetical protein [Candidatus Neomarinimicrobiota bacterium]
MSLSIRSYITGYLPKIRTSGTKCQKPINNGSYLTWQYPIKINYLLSDQKTALGFTLRYSDNRIVSIDHSFMDRFRDIKLVTRCGPEQALLPYADNFNKLELLDLHLMQCILIESHYRCQVPEYARMVRSLLLELYRLFNHFNFFISLANAVHFTKFGRVSHSCRSIVQPLLQQIQAPQIPGHYFIPGGVNSDLPPGFLERVIRSLNPLKTGLKYLQDQFRKKTILSDQLENIGIISREKATLWHFSGPNRRASDRHYQTDSTAIDTLNVASESEEINFSKGTAGDAWHRGWIRLTEVKLSLNILEQLVKQIFKTDVMLSNPAEISGNSTDFAAHFTSAEGNIKGQITGNANEKFFTGKYQYPVLNVLTHLGPILTGERVSSIGIILSSLNLNPVKYHFH